MSLLKITAVLFFSLQLFSCGGDLKPCKGKVYCDEDEDCLYIHAGKNGYFCVRQCISDDDCYPWYSFHNVLFPLKELGYDTVSKYDYEIEERNSELHKIPNYGDHMTMEQFKKYVDSRMFIDYDGSGDLATEDKCSDIPVSPSYLAVDGYEIPDWATHVVWYNK